VGCYISIKLARQTKSKPPHVMQITTGNVIRLKYTADLFKRITKGLTCLPCTVKIQSSVPCTMRAVNTFYSCAACV